MDSVRPREEERDKERGDERQQKDRDRDREGRSREGEREGDKGRSSDRDRERDRDRGKERSNNRDGGGERDRDRDKERGRDSRDGDRDKDKDKERDSDKDRDRGRSGDGSRDKGGPTDISRDKKERNNNDNREERKRKNHSDQSSSESSDESSDEKHRHKRSKKEKKERKKEKKKHKKEKKERRHKKDKKDKKDKKLDAGKQTLKGNNMISTISDNDYFNKSAEYRTWLREVKRTYLEDLKSTEESRRLFSLFVEDWNSGMLPDKYYRGISIAQEDPSARTKYKWGFAKNLDAVELGTLRDAVDTDNNKTFAQMSKRMDAKKSVPEPYSAPSAPVVPVVVGPIGPMLKRNDQDDDEDLDEEDRQRIARARGKKDMKDFQRTKEVVMEELVPKATGRDAMIEKRKARAEYTKKKDDSPEMNESDLMGGNNDEFKARLSREKQMKAKKELERGQEYAKKVAEAKAKEDERMAPLRALAQRFSHPQV